MRTTLDHPLNVVKARANLVMGHPFFGSLALRMRLIADEEKAKDSRGNPTMATDGEAIYYHPEFVKNKTMEQLMAVFAHEVMHTAMMHHTRQGYREHTKWNAAGDYAINAILRNNFALPEPHLYEKAFEDMSSEEIYSKLPNQQSNGNDWGSIGASTGIVLPAPRQGNQTQDQANRQAEATMKVALAQAAYVARQAGRLPGDLERLIGEVLEPVLPWANILRRFMTETQRGDISWNYPSRRAESMGVFLPSINEDDPHMKDIIVAVDTSGSIGANELNAFGAEINAIHEDLQPRQTIVIYCDAGINGEPIIFGPDDEVVLEPRGGGGTDFRPPFSLVEEMRWNPQCFVYLTDGYGAFPEREPDYPVMWAITTDLDAPWGETLRLVF